MHDLEPQDNFLGQIRKPKLSDKELIALNLAAEAASIDSELSLFSQLPIEISDKIERSVYNKRRRRLSPKTQQLQMHIANTIIPHESYHLIDSMPLEVCKMSRARRSRICSKHPESAPDYGYCAAQKLHYFGYKIHAVCTQQGVFKAFDISKASVHDFTISMMLVNNLNIVFLLVIKAILVRLGKLIYLTSLIFNWKHPHAPINSYKNHFPRFIEVLESVLKPYFLNYVTSL